MQFKYEKPKPRFKLIQVEGYAFGQTNCIVNDQSRNPS